MVDDDQLLSAKWLSKWKCRDKAGHNGCYVADCHHAW